jgi:hypothetical protein
VRTSSSSADIAGFILGRALEAQNLTVAISSVWQSGGDGI